MIKFYRKDLIMPYTSRRNHKRNDLVIRFNSYALALFYLEILEMNFVRGDCNLKENINIVYQIIN